MNWLTKKLKALTWFKAEGNQTPPAKLSVVADKSLPARPKSDGVYRSSWARHRDKACVKVCWYCEMEKFTKEQDRRANRIWTDRPELRPIGYHRCGSEFVTGSDGPLPIKKFN